MGIYQPDDTSDFRIIVSFIRFREIELARPAFRQGGSRPIGRA